MSLFFLRLVVLQGFGRQMNTLIQDSLNTPF